MQPTETSAERPDNSRADAPQNPSGTRSTARRVSIRTILALVLIVYWVSMFCGTHVPKIPNGLATLGDKVLHCGAYAGLAVLLMCWRASRGQTSWKTPLLLWLMLAAYGAFDEVTQIPVGRHADVDDWLADLVGAACGLAISMFIARSIFNRRAAATPSAG